MSRATIQLRTQADRDRASAWVRKAPSGTTVEFRRPRRTTDQNALLWAMLSEIASKVDWYGNKLTADEWKTVFTAALRKARVVPGIDGGFVVLGLSTSAMTKSELGELIDLMNAFAAERGLELKA